MLPAFVERDDASTIRRVPRDAAGPFTDRRGSRRLPIEIDVTVEGAAHRFTAPTGDLSCGGLFVLTACPIPIGTHVMLAFTLPNGAALEVLGVVQWARDGDDDSVPGLGVSFFCLEPEARAVLQGFCSIREAFY
jgi:uncharacterized protein (TIGR02266 family)